MLKMASEKSKKDLLRVKTAIPKIANALQSIIASSKDKELQQRCLHNIQVHDLDAVSNKVEAKLWKIADRKLGVHLPNETEEDQGLQVVPKDDKVPPKSRDNKNSKAKEFQRLSSYQKEPFDEDDFFDITSPQMEKIEESFYEPKEIQQNTGNVMSKTGLIPNLHPSKSSEAMTDNDYWLSNFANDSYWMENCQDCHTDGDKKQRSATCTSENTGKHASTIEDQSTICNFLSSDQIIRSDTGTVQNKINELQHHKTDDHSYTSSASSDNLSSPSIGHGTKQDGTHNHLVSKSKRGEKLENKIVKTVVNDTCSQEDSEIQILQVAEASDSCTTINNSFINDFDALADFFDEKDGVIIVED